MRLFIDGKVFVYKKEGATVKKRHIETSKESLIMYLEHCKSCSSIGNTDKCKECVDSGRYKNK